MTARVQINGNALDVSRTGAGEPVVVVHGNWTGGATFARAAELLSDRYEVVTYDRLGYNTSDRPDGSAYTRARHEDDLIALVEHLDRGPAHLVGNSYGGSVVLGVAARRPDLARTVTVHEAALPGIATTGAAAAALQSIGCVARRIEAGEVAAGTRQFFEEVALGPGGWEMLPDAIRAMALHNATTFAAEMRDARATTIDLGAVAAYPGRIMLTQGELSPQWFGDVMAVLGRALPHARRVTMRGTGHGPHTTHPEEWTELVADFIGAKVALPG